jgi:diguanylate cyclase (GGDEF)-like protein
VLLLPNTDCAGAEAAAERARMAVFDQQLPHQYSATADRVTISLGVAAAQPGGGETSDNLTAENLLKAADDALYQAKNSGRNRVACVRI